MRLVQDRGLPVPCISDGPNTTKNACTWSRTKWCLSSELNVRGQSERLPRGKGPEMLAVGVEVCSVCPWHSFYVGTIWHRRVKTKTASSGHPTKAVEKTLIFLCYVVGPANRARGTSDIGLFVAGGMRCLEREKGSSGEGGKVRASWLISVTEPQGSPQEWQRATYCGPNWQGLTPELTDCSTYVDAFQCPIASVRCQWSSWPAGPPISPWPPPQRSFVQGKHNIDSHTAILTFLSRPSPRLCLTDVHRASNPNSLGFTSYYLLQTSRPVNSRHTKTQLQARAGPCLTTSPELCQCRSYPQHSSFISR